MLDGKNRRLLFGLLSILVREYGIEEVRGHLADIEKSPEEWEGINKPSDKAQRRAQKRKISAVELVQRASLPEEMKPVVTRIAERFDARSFLPSGGAVRNFLAMRGADVGTYKRR